MHLLASDVRSEIGHKGFATISGIQLAGVMSLAKELGEVTMDKRSPDLYRRISPQNLDVAKINTLSSRYGMGEFPFHTDVAHWKKPASYVLLYCEHVGAGHRPTQLIDTHAWSISTSLRHSLTCELWKSGYLSPMLCTVGSDVNGDLSIRYDLGCMRPIGTKSHKLKKQLGVLVLSSEKVAINWTCGLLVLIDNTRLLHARGQASVPDTDRVIIRVLVGGKQ